MEALEIYNKLSRPPVDALRQIEAGKLRGKTDINPQWRYKAMTETFGLVGQGWKYEIQKLWTAPGAGTEVLAFAQVAVYVKQNDEWSEPIIGIGGSKLVMTELRNWLPTVRPRVWVSSFGTTPMVLGTMPLSHLLARWTRVVNVVQKWHG